MLCQSESLPYATAMIKKIILIFIKLYQRTLSLDHGPLGYIWSERFCRFHPSCSEYTRVAVVRYGAVPGVALGLRRILKCHPWNPGGYDPVP